MSIFSKNKNAFIALTLLSSYSLMQGAFARLQSVRPAVSAVAGLRSLSGYSHGADQAMRMWESRQKQLDDLGGIPKKVQKAAHIISRDQPKISPAIHVIKKYGLYDVVTQTSKLPTYSGVSRIEIAPEIHDCMGGFVRAELNKIVSAAAIEKLKISEYTQAGTGSSDCFFRMGTYSTRGEVLIGRGFIQFLQEIKSKHPDVQRSYETCIRKKKVNLDIFVGLFLHELGHIYQQHGLKDRLMLEKITNNKITQENLIDLVTIGSYWEQEADAFVISHGNFKFAKGTASFLKSRLTLFSNFNNIFHNFLKEIIIEDFPNKNESERVKDIRFLLENSYPSFQERIAFFERELAVMQQQEAAQK